jgi:hypothetical protein
MEMVEDLEIHHQSIVLRRHNQEPKMMMETGAIHFQHIGQNLQCIGSKIHKIRMYLLSNTKC